MHFSEGGEVVLELAIAHTTTPSRILPDCINFAGLEGVGRHRSLSGLLAVVGLERRRLMALLSVPRPREAVASGPAVVASGPAVVEVGEGLEGLVGC